MLVVATLLEKVYGTEVIHSSLYGSVPFVLLWGVLSVAGGIYLFRRRVQKRPVVLALHLSFLLILAGALTTWLCGEQGIIHLREQHETGHFTRADDQSVALPFRVKLEQFDIVYYTGTPAPMDFVSSVVLTDNRGEVVKGEVSMNNIFSHHGYRFYQSGYDEDEGGVTLAVSHDPYGIAVTYTGYALLLLSIAFFCFCRDSHFRRLLKHPLLARGTVVLLLLFCVNELSATELPKALPREVAAGFGDLYILYNDRICPLQTLARDFTVKLYGSPTYKGLTAEQVFTGWMFYYSNWKKQPLIKIKSGEVRHLLGVEGRYASSDDFSNAVNEYKLDEAMRQLTQGERLKARKGIEEANEKYSLIASLYAGRLLKIYPHQQAGSGEVRWFAQGEMLPGNMDESKWIFIRKSLDYIHEMVIKADHEGVAELVSKVKAYQEKEGKGVLPTSHRFEAEKAYNRMGYTKLLSMVCLTIGVFSFFYHVNRTVHRQPLHPGVTAGLSVVLALLFAYLTALIGLRWVISGHVPLSNGYETMQFMAWCAALLSLVFRRRFVMLYPFGFLVCGLTLLVAMMGEATPRITPLMPVLSSPLLSIHVAVIMASYSLFAFMMLNGITALILHGGKGRHAQQIEHLQVVSQLMLYPAVFCLAIGIFVGAVWANISWGRYWGWDPKEVWALITLLVYSLALHTESLPRFRQPLFFHLFAVIAFLSVLITYFGVNLILGGIHSYA